MTRSFINSWSSLRAQVFSRKKTPRRKSARTAPGRRLAAEPLEGRAMLSGNVTAWVTSGTLFVRGDSRSNGVAIEQMSPTSFRVSGIEAPGYATGQDSTSLNGRRAPTTFYGVYDDLDISLGDGADSVRLSGRSYSNPMVLADDLRINMGSGNDQVSMSFVCNRDFNDRMTIDLGSGDNGASFRYVTSQDYLTVYGGSGRDSVSLDSINVIGTGRSTSRLTVSLGAGDDWLTYSAISVSYVTFSGGSGYDTFKGRRFTQTDKQSYTGFERFISTDQFF